MKVLTDILNEDPNTHFLAKVFTRYPYSLPDNARKYAEFLNWDVVQKVMDEKKSITRIVKDSVLIKEGKDITFEEAKEFYQKGHTILLRYAEKSHPLLKYLASDFSTSFKTDVDIQLYCTPENNNAFDWHYDVEEVFIIQTKGSKRYAIRPNTVHPKPLLRSIPRDLHYEKETSELVLDVLLTEGDFLYIPSGWWHRARTQSESMHISIGLMPRSAVDILDFLPQELLQNSFWRSRLPVYKTFNTEEEEILFYKETFERLGSELFTLFQDPEFIRAFLKEAKRKYQSMTSLL